MASANPENTSTNAKPASTSNYTRKSTRNKGALLDDTHIIFNVFFLAKGNRSKTSRKNASVFSAIIFRSETPNNRGPVKIDIEPVILIDGRRRHLHLGRRFMKK